MSGGFAMWPLLICSILTWVVVLERLWRYRRLGQDLRDFHLEAVNALLRGDRRALWKLCDSRQDLPTARLLHVALERLSSKDKRLRAKWIDAIERSRQLVNQELRQNLWILGTVGSAAPFIGLFGTVVGVLQSFHDIAKTGKGGFSIVAGGISEALIATAAGIVVAVVAVLAFNAFQTRWQALVLTVRVHTEELLEILEGDQSLMEGLVTDGVPHSGGGQLSG